MAKYRLSFVRIPSPVVIDFLKRKIKKAKEEQEGNLREFIQKRKLPKMSKNRDQLKDELSEELWRVVECWCEPNDEIYSYIDALAERAIEQIELTDNDPVDEEPTEVLYEDMDSFGEG